MKSEKKIFGVEGCLITFQENVRRNLTTASTPHLEYRVIHHSTQTLARNLVNEWVITISGSQLDDQSLFSQLNALFKNVFFAQFKYLKHIFLYKLPSTKCGPPWQKFRIGFRSEPIRRTLPNHSDWVGLIFKRFSTNEIENTFRIGSDWLAMARSQISQLFGMNSYPKISSAYLRRIISWFNTSRVPSKSLSKLSKTWRWAPLSFICKDIRGKGGVEKKWNVAISLLLSSPRRHSGRSRCGINERILYVNDSIP